MFNQTRYLKFNRGMRYMLAGLSLGYGVAAQGAGVTWKITMAPGKSGEIAWETSNPQKSGVLQASGSLSFDEGSYVDLTFTPKPGYRLVSVYKNLDNWTSSLDDNNHFRFGPVTNHHLIAAQFELITPTGAYDFSPPANLPEGVAAIFNGTGHYSGHVPADMPVVANKAFDADVAMDESGKLDIMPNSLEGYTPDSSANTSIVGALKTRHDKPEVTVSAKFKGQFAGYNGEGSGVGTLSAIDTQNQLAKSLQAGDSTLDASGTGSYKVKLKDSDSGNKLSYTEKEAAVSAPVATDATRDWSVHVVISQEQDAKGKPVTYAQGTLTLPTGDKVAFPKRKVKYSKTKGYKIAFSRGTNMTSNEVDKKTKLSIANMLFDCADNNCELNDGQISYQFLGQKGKGKLTDFILN